MTPGSRWPRSSPRRHALFPSRPVLGTFLVMFAIINVAYFAYGAWFAVDQGEWCSDVGGLSVAVPGGQSL